jgi:hypothetical protein
VVEEGPDVVGQRFHVGIPLLPIPLHGLPADRFEFGRNLVQGTPFPRRHRRADLGLPQDLGHRGPGVRRLVREHLVEEGPQGVDVRLFGYVLHVAARLLGGHVGRRSDDVPVQRPPRFRLVADRVDESGPGPILSVADLGQPPVHDQHFPERADHDVFRFEVAVDNALAVGEGDGVAHLQEDLKALRGGEAGGGGIVAVGDAVDEGLEGFASHELHGEVDPAVRVQAQLVDGHDVGVLELAGDLGLLDEPFDPFGILLAEDHLHGHGTPDVVVHGLEDGAHAAAGDFPQGGVPFARGFLPVHVRRFLGFGVVHGPSPVHDAIASYRGGGGNARQGRRRGVERVG